ncbi:hypothetical protein SAMN02745130_03036 [Thiothrix eikelboomii]|uniref:Dolichyl-phosphate-mannose-protein mannosyltransferase n=1 Tax=Thiothrix eikelboomii TaxID=92487 RepID=A0A1T4XIR8_9GAMM|nr:hypothetical protein [Thiothrix eikelboomii]SKA89407.1 hypothetical protein SAMN02745130_03036 [Thiothrix eikelboomii]
MLFFSSKTAFDLLILITLAKFIAFFYIKADSDIFESIFLSGNDSGYYHAYAMGEVSEVTSVWPIFLKFLHEYGLYDRYVISVILFLISIFIPFIFASLLLKTEVFNNAADRKVYWNFILLISCYPSIFLLSLDIYRDMAMLFLFSITLWLIKKYIEKNQRGKTLLILPIILLIYLLFLFREYLGVSILAGLFSYKLKISKNKKYYFFVLYFLALAILNNFGYLNPLLEYRGQGFTTGNTTLGVSLLNTDTLSFFVLYLYSAIMQLSGFFITSIPSIFIFFTESVFFIIATIYIIRNSNLLTPFARFLIIFSLFYASIWIIGNDNIGTAARLRTFNYISIYLIASIVYIEKLKIHRSKLKKNI